MHSSKSIAGLALAVTAVVAGCEDHTAPEAAVVGRFAVAPTFRSAFAGVVPVDRMRVVLRRLANDAVALDTVYALDVESDSVDVSVRVVLASPNEQFRLTIALVTPQGDTAFRAGPTTVTASMDAAQEQTPVSVPLEYTGVGADAVRVAITSQTQSVLFGDTATLTAAAYDSNDEPLAGTPIAWYTLDSARASVPDRAVGRVVGGTSRGDARIIAALLTGPADTALIAVQPTAISLVAASATNVTGVVGATLDSPLTVRATAADGLGVADVTVQFAVTGGGGSVAPTLVVTDTAGEASATWTLGLSAGTQTVQASSPGLAGSPLTFTATALVAGGNTFGNYDDLGQSSTHFADYLLGSPIVLPEAALLTHLGILARAAGPNVKLGLYSDADGEPYQLIVEVPSTPLVQGRMEIPVTPTALSAGTYWFMAVYDVDASVGYSTSNPSAVVKYVSLSFTNPLPATFPGATTYYGQEFNYYIRVAIP